MRPIKAVLIALNIEFGLTIDSRGRVSTQFISSLEFGYRMVGEVNRESVRQTMGTTNAEASDG